MLSRPPRWGLAATSREYASRAGQWHRLGEARFPSRPTGPAANAASAPPDL